MKKSCLLILKLSVITIMFWMMSASIDAEPLHTEVTQVLMPYIERGELNGNLLVARSNKLLHLGSYGYANEKRTEKLGANSLFELGSITKEFNSVAIMMLVEQGKLHLSDSLDSFGLNLPSWSTKIQVKHLLNYTSGLPKFNFRAVTDKNSDLRMLKELKQLEFEPGSNYLYSNHNVFLQIRIIERLSGMNYQQFLKKHVFAPLQMKNTKVSPTSSEMSPVRSFDLQLKASPNLDDFPIKGMVALNIQDLSKWVFALHQGKLISEHSLKALSNSFEDGKQSSLGVVKYNNGELKVHEHHGTNFNFESFFHYDANRDLLVIIMTNQKQKNLRLLSSTILAAFNAAG